MKVDRYTKAVLTVIAGCLLWICAMGTGPSLAAQPRATIANDVQPVVIVGSGTLDQQGHVTVHYVRTPDGRSRTNPTVAVSLPYTAANPLPTRLLNSPEAPLAVEIAAVKKTGEWEPIRAKVEDAPARPKPGGGDQR